MLVVPRSPTWLLASDVNTENTTAPPATPTRGCHAMWNRSSGPDAANNPRAIVAPALTAPVRRPDPERGSDQRVSGYGPVPGAGFGAGAAVCTAWVRFPTSAWIEAACVLTASIAACTSASDTEP